MIQDIDEDGSLKSLEDFFKNRRLCEEKGHPFPESIAVPYQPGSDILVRCSGCGMLYERPATREEKQSYRDIMKLLFTI
jgi:hypothetical protein